MQCPVCKNHEHSDTHLQTGQFDENLMKCKVCGSIWAVNHGVVEVVTDSQAASFLEGTTECVEGDDYNRT